MWDVSGINLQMAEGDFGIELPVVLSGTTLVSTDTLKYTFKDTKNGTTILTKDLVPDNHNTVILEFTEAETALFPVGVYCYSLDWYELGNFMCNIVPIGVFKVVDKA